MGDTFRARLVDELAEAGEPPIGDLVDASIARGRRLELRRRLEIGGAALAVAGLLGLTVAGASLAGGRDHGAPPDPVAAAPVPVMPPASAVPPRPAMPPPPVTVTPIPPGKLVKATPAALLELLTRLLPPGPTGDYAGIADDVSGGWTVQTSLDRGAGPGMIRLTVGPRGGLGKPGEGSLAPKRICDEANTAVCSVPPELPAGELATRPDGVVYQVTRDAADCTRSIGVTVLQPSGVEISLDLATCREAGREMVVTKPALTAAEAVAIGCDPRWGLSLDPKLVKTGAKRFPRLPEKLGR